jgi:uncharacterized protein (TIGR02300 family)
MSPAKKTTRKTVRKKPAQKKTTARKSSAKTSSATKKASKPPAAKKGTAKKAAAKKPSAKAAPRKAASGKAAAAARTKAATSKAPAVKKAAAKKPSTKAAPARDAAAKTSPAARKPETSRKAPAVKRAPARQAAGGKSRPGRSRAQSRAAKSAQPAAPTHRLGNKFTCFSCGAKFYDLNRPEPLCPKCGEDQRKAPKAPPRGRAQAPAEAKPSRQTDRRMAPLLDEDEEVVVSAVEEKEEELDIGLGVAADPVVGRRARCRGPTRRCIQRPPTPRGRAWRSARDAEHAPQEQAEPVRFSRALRPLPLARLRTARLCRCTRSNSPKRPDPAAVPVAGPPAALRRRAASSDS